MDFPNACQECQRDDAGRVTRLCDEGLRLQALDAATPAGSSPDAYRRYVQHLWGMEMPPPGGTVAGAIPYPDRHAWQDADAPGEPGLAGTVEGTTRLAATRGPETR